MFKISREVVESFADLGNIHKEIFISWKDALDQFNRYQEFSDYGYIKEGFSHCKFKIK